MFGKRGYEALDIVRPVIWDDEKIKIHYKQNTILYVRKESLPELRVSHTPGGSMLSVVHPHYYEKFANPTMKTLFSKGVFTGILGRALKKSVGRIFNRPAS